jgi:hypothetical protein
VVVSGVAPHITVEPSTKFVPVTVSVNGAAPATAEFGFRLAIVGALAMVNAEGAESRPLALTTRMEAVPGAVSSDAGTVAVQELEFVHEEASRVVCEPNVQVAEERLVNPVPEMVTG